MPLTADFKTPSQDMLGLPNECKARGGEEATERWSGPASHRSWKPPTGCSWRFRALGVSYLVGGVEEVLRGLGSPLGREPWSQA
jgi:hypothetical protein